MTYLTYLTPSCAQDARKHGVEADVLRLAKKVESDQSISSWNKFQNPYIKKSLGRDWRLIAARVVPPEHDDTIVVTFLTLLSRGSREYESFRRDQVAFGTPLLPTNEAIKSVIAERSEKVVVLPPAPSEIESSYLYCQFAGPDKSYGMVYESKDWVELISKADAQLGWYWELVCQALDPKNADKTILRKQNLQIIYRYFRESNALLLIAPINDQDPERRSDVEARYARLIQPDAKEGGRLLDFIDEVELLKHSAHAYPALVTADPDVWQRTQKSKEANLALSPEESFILDSVSHPSPRGKVFPLFINGRPGSGKSTILQYLFAEHLYSHVSKGLPERLPYPPIYLTYSDKLLQWAKKVVRSIILCSSKLASQGTDFDQKEFNDLFDDCFGEFHKFLYSLLPAADQSNFDPEKRIDFPEFRRRWTAKIKADPDQELRKLSPELVWHVIRTYIKGMRDDESNWLDPIGYSDLPNKQHTVETKTYQKIFDRAWEAWYKKLSENEGYWDDQDLTRSLLDLVEEKVIHISNHPVVFCDEAQDFTKVELEVILRLSLFSQRALRGDVLKRVPFAFAGDPFQTLNPTGFDWDSVQAGFHETIVQELDKSLRGNLEFNYQELHFNYRSSQSIVGFCNLIQVLRGILFKVNYLKPQRTWFDESAPPPVYFDVDQPSCQEKLREQDEVVIIIPCQEGEEKSYIEADSFLKQLAASDLRNFLSPMSAKGLEFSRVVLYKFGEEYLQNYKLLLKPLETGRPYGESSEDGLPYQYFINRLYVAASRPKRRLFIVDSQEAIERFWKCDSLRDKASLLEKYSTAKTNDWTVEDLSFINPGLEQDWSEERDNPFELANQFLEEGRAAKDPYKLALAEANFRRAGRPQDEQEVRALRLEVEGNYVAAAKEYVALRNDRQALRLFWKARAYDDIYKNSSFTDTIEHRAAGFKLMQKSAAGCVNFLDFLFEETTGIRQSNILTDRQWFLIADELISALANTNQEEINWKQIYSKIEQMTSSGFEFSKTSEFAQVAFRAGKYAEAVSIWDADSNLSQKSPSYKKAKAAIVPFPEQIKWLVELGEYEDVVAVYETNAQETFTPEYIPLIFEAFVEVRRYEAGIEFLKLYPTEDLLDKLLNELWMAKRTTLAHSCATLLLKSKLRASNWSDAIRLVENSNWNRDEKLRLRNELIIELAASEVLVVDPIANKKAEVADYLKKNLDQLSASPSLNEKLIGAAIERAGRFIDALAYYESIRKSEKQGKSPRRDYARKRWLKCKYRFAEYLQSQAKDGDAYRHKREADRLASEWMINAESVPEFPILRASDDVQPETLEENNQPALSDERVRAVQALLRDGWSLPRVSNVLGIPLEDLAAVEITHAEEKEKRNSLTEKQDDGIDFYKLKPNIVKGTKGVNNLFRGIKNSAGPWLRNNSDLATEVYDEIHAAGSEGMTTRELSNENKRKAAYRLAVVGLIMADTLDKDTKERRFRTLIVET